MTARENTTATYVDGFVIPVPTVAREAFRQHASEASLLFLEWGALRITECWGDDVPPGKVTDFSKAVQAQADETVVFSWVEWPSKAVRDAAMEKMMTDPRMSPDNNPMPFDGKRMIFGGFVPIVDTIAHCRNHGES